MLILQRLISGIVLNSPAAPISAIALCFCFAALSACGKADYHTAGGTSGNFADTRGKWLFINYWAQWCKPCIQEMPELQRFQQQYRDRAIVFTVNYDGAQGEELQQQIEKIGVALPVLLEDPATQLGAQRPDVLPTTLVFDPAGELRHTLQGEQTIATLADAMDTDANTKNK